MTTPTQKGKATAPSKIPGRAPGGKQEVTIEVKLQGSPAALDTDYAAIVGASYTADAVTITMH